MTVIKYLGLLSQMLAAYFTFFSNAEDHNILIAVCLIVGLAYPLLPLSEKNATFDTAIVGGILSFIVMVILGIALRENRDGFISEFFAEITSKGFFITYICMFLLADIGASAKLSFFFGIVAGALLPVILSFVIIIAILIIAAVVALITGKNNSSSASISSNSASKLTETPQSSPGQGLFSGSMQYYAIWNEHEHGQLHDVIIPCNRDLTIGDAKNYITNVMHYSYSPRILLLKPYDRLHDSISEYWSQLKGR